MSEPLRLMELVRTPKVRETHKERMHRKAARRERDYRELNGYGLNLTTSKYMPHQSDREIGRRQAREIELANAR